MSETEVFNGRRYEIVAFANGQTPIHYEELEAGEWGPWLLLAKDAYSIFVYTGDSTFCPYCQPDDFGEEFGLGPYLFTVGLDSQVDLDKHVVSEQLRQAFESNHVSLSEGKVTITAQVEGSGWKIELEERGSYEAYYVVKKDDALEIYIYCGLDDDSVPYPSVTQDEARAFVNRGDYKPLVVVPIETMRRLYEDGMLAEVLPEVLPDNIRGRLRDEVARTIMTAAGLGMGWPLVADEADKELRSHALNALLRGPAVHVDTLGIDDWYVAWAIVGPVVWAIVSLVGIILSAVFSRPSTSLSPDTIVFQGGGFPMVQVSGIGFAVIGVGIGIAYLTYILTMPLRRHRSWGGGPSFFCGHWAWPRS